MRPFHGFEVPHRLRAFIRARESSIILLAAVVGGLAGVVVAVMGAIVAFMHLHFFGLDPGERLSGRTSIDPIFAFLVPTLGGLALGVATWWISRWRGTEVDPIEANALHGGRMSMRGSLIVAAQTIWSSGVGASVGLEAGYTQLSSGLASKIGQAFRLRRSDMRLLVGCGAAGAIAGAFGAPLGGAFYGFELIIGSYAVSSLAPVGVAALFGYFTAAAFSPDRLGIEAAQVTAISFRDLAMAGGFGLLAAGFGILIMRSVAACEVLLGRLGIRPWLRPVLGGAIVGLMAIITPRVMSSGHGALHLTTLFQMPVATLATLLLFKSFASIVSLGTGFRGGLFFASLLLGALGGQLFAIGMNTVWPALHVNADAYAVIGMSALAASVIGGPLTMCFIALETTGDLWLTGTVLIAVIVSMQVTREFFGYSFATWRFHLRGETIRGGADIGWIRDLTVAQMMRSDVRTTSTETPLPAFRQNFPLGSTNQVIAIDEDGRYAGMVMVAEAHSTEVPPVTPLTDLLRHKGEVLLQQMTAQEAIKSFEKFEAEALPVVDSAERGQVVGMLTESHALRRFSDASERQRRALIGEL
ncbi:MAG: chloride channel protein [Proteobacteria bacterium]|nr:chloride channel protein [Pseudomonadota bacterium]